MDFLPKFLFNADLVLTACALFFATIGVAQWLMATQVLSPAPLRRMGLSHLMLALAFGSRIFWDGQQFSQCLVWSQLGYTLNAFLFLSVFSQYRKAKELPLWVWYLTPVVQLPVMIGLVWPQWGTYGMGVSYLLTGLVHAANWHFCGPDADPIKTRIFWMFRAQAVLGAWSFIVWGIWLLVQPAGRDISLDRWLAAVHFMLAFWICQITALSFGYMLMRDMLSDIERRSNTDPLTGAHNRLGLQKHLVKRDRRHKTPPGLAALIIDLDNFKAINDTWGHSAGDQVLSQCASRLRSELRADNLFVRLGGEEFLVLLEHTPLAPALVVAERLRLAIQAKPIVLEDGQSLSVTTSVGVATQTDISEPVPRLITRADEALYQAKRNGRNRVVAASS